MNTIVKKVIFTTLAGSMFGLIPLSLQAESMSMRGPIPFSAYDTNKDGSINEEEFSTTQAKRMQERSESGYPMRNANNAPSFEYFDTNSDGKITKEELLEGQNKRMQQRGGGMGMGKGPNR